MTDLKIPRVEALGADYPLWMSAEQASRFLGVSAPTMRRMIDRGDVQASKHPTTGVWRVGTVSLCEYLGIDFGVAATGA